MAQVKWSDVLQTETEAISNKRSQDEIFDRYVKHCRGRFAMADWGDVTELSQRDNDVDFRALNEGKFGRILAAYKSFKIAGSRYPSGKTTAVPMPTIWIVRAIVDYTGRQAITVMFPEDY